VKFIGDHLEQTRSIFQDEVILFSDQLPSLRLLLEKIAIQLTVFESDHSGIDIVYPAIRTLCHDVEQEGRRLPSDMADAHRQFSLIVRRLCIETTAGLFQRAHILTPRGEWRRGTNCVVG
jgi:hypothetical protein